LVYGARLVSNLPLPGLTFSGGSEPVTIQVHLNEKADFSSRFSTSLGAIFYSSLNSELTGGSNLHAGVLNGGAYYGFFYNDGPRFAIDRQGREIWGDFPDGYSLEDVCTYLIGQILNFALLLRGGTALHASSIAVGNSAIAVMGMPGAGKSTTAAAFARLGYPILSDDVAVLTEKGTRFIVQPGYPRVNLWPDSVRSLFGSEDELPFITPTWGKRFLPLDRDGYRFQSDPLPLSAVYMLDEREELLAAPVIEELTGAKALMILAGNTYLNFLLNADMRRREFEVLGRVAASVHVRRVHPAADPSKIFDLCETIAADADRLTKWNAVNAASDSI
jgi:hypothetical protein